MTTGMTNFRLPMLFEVRHQCISNAIEDTLMTSRRAILGNLLSLVTDEDFSILYTPMINTWNCGKRKSILVVFTSAPGTILPSIITCTAKCHRCKSSPTGTLDNQEDWACVP